MKEVVNNEDNDDKEIENEYEGVIHKDITYNEHETYWDTFG